MNWISTKDRLPEIYDISYSILIYRLHSPLGSAVCEIAVWRNGKFYSCNYCTDYDEFEIDPGLVTHWMKLPKSPEEQCEDDVCLPCQCD